MSSQETAVMLTVSSMALTAQLWAARLPECATVASWPATPERVTGVAHHCCWAGGVALVAAAGASYAARSWWPLLGSAALSAYLAGSYHAAVRQAPYAHVESTPSPARWGPR